MPHFGAVGERLQGKRPRSVASRVILVTIVIALATGAAGQKPPVEEPQNTLQTPGVRRMTLEEVKQQVAAASNPLVRLGQLSVEKAREHRLGVEADYFPKLSAGFMNLHYSEFLGQVITIRRPLVDPKFQRAVPLFSDYQTAVNVSLVQPITPLFKVYQAVKIARADEQIANAKAAAPIAANDATVEEAYYKLLIAQRRLTYAELNLRSLEHQTPTGGGSIVSVRATNIEAKRALVTGATEVRELTPSLDRLMGWPDSTPLELMPPDPLTENISLQEIADKLGAASGPGLVEAEQNVVKARAAYTLSKLEYVPTVAAVGGFLNQNVVPLVPADFGYGGVIATYTLFDFGKRERAIKEARVQLQMAQIAVQLTKAQASAKLKDSYFELERSRQLSRLAQAMGSSIVQLVELSSTSENPKAEAARAKAELEMLEADLAHRQAYARLKALMGTK